ncbi:MAG: glucose-6-phosphate isomerase [Anaerolineae bacterium]
MTTLQLDLGRYQADYERVRATLSDNKIIERIHSGDHTVWHPEPTEISNRLGWLTVMDQMQTEVERIQALADTLRDEGYTNALLLGMGGSSLAPEVLSFVFDEGTGIDLDVLDSTDPAMVQGYEDRLDLQKTVFIVSTKSGGTAETLSFFKYFYNRVLATVGGDVAQAGLHFVGITDPGSKLERLGEQHRFRAVFLNDPNIGGRYSVLSHFGMVPATLLGVDVAEFLQRAGTMAERCVTDDDNPALDLGAVLGALAQQGRDKLTLFNSPVLANFGDWVEQLIAESTGKDGTGILPIVGEQIGAPDVYGADRLFVYVKVGDDDTYDSAIDALRSVGQPVVTLAIDGKYDLAGQFFLWELATAVVGHVLGIHPFDQPNVESAKKLARAKIDAYMASGSLEQLPVSAEADGMQVLGSTSADSPQSALAQFIADAQAGAYVALHAYIPMTTSTMDVLTHLQSKIRDVSGLATTIGFGPRFLHSTGQLHKGDAGKGLFVQFTADTPNDLPIPDEVGADASGMSFGTLEMAQALGDRDALLEADRQVLHIRLSAIEDNLKTLIDSL